MQIVQCGNQKCRLRKPVNQMINFNGYWCSERCRIEELQRVMQAVPRNMLLLNEPDHAHFRPDFCYGKRQQLRAHNWGRHLETGETTLVVSPSIFSIFRKRSNRYLWVAVYPASYSEISSISKAWIRSFSCAKLYSFILISYNVFTYSSRMIGW